MLAQWLSWQERLDSFEAFSEWLDDPGQRSVVHRLYVEAASTVTKGPDYAYRRRAAMRDMAFYLCLATAVNAEVYQRLEPLGLQTALWLSVLPAIARQLEEGTYDPERWGWPPFDARIAAHVADVQGVAAAAERIHRDYFRGIEVLFPAEQPRLYVLETHALVLHREAMTVLGPDRGAALTDREEMEGEVAERLVKEWTEEAARQTASLVPVPQRDAKYA